MSRILGFELAGSAALAFAVVVTTNWRAAVAAVRRPQQPRPFLVFLVGPVHLVVLVLGLRAAVDGLSGSTVVAILGAGLVIDPAALPIVVFGVVRRLLGLRDAD